MKIDLTKDALHKFCDKVKDLADGIVHHGDSDHRAELIKEFRDKLKKRISEAVEIEHALAKHSPLHSFDVSFTAPHGLKVTLDFGEG